MDKIEALRKINYQIKKNRSSYDHNVNVWLDFINTYPQHKELITTMIHEDYFSKKVSKSKSDSYMIDPVLSALALSKYFDEICFPNNEFSQKAKDKVSVGLFDFYYSTLRRLPLDKLIKFNSYLRTTVIKFNSSSVETLNFSKELIQELKESTPNLNFIRNIYAIFFDELYIPSSAPTFKSLSPTLRAIHYFRIITLGIFPDIVAIKDRIENDRFSLINEVNWVDSILHFFRSHEIHPYLKGQFRLPEKLVNLQKHFEEFIMNEPLILLINLKHSNPL